MSYFDHDFASLAIECGSHSDYVECQFSHALTPIRKVPPSATSGRLVTITPLTTLLISPPHSTHRLQPLDVSLFGPLANFYTQNLNSPLYNSLGIGTMTKCIF